MARILSIEDDVDLQQVIAYALKKKNWEVVFAYDGKDGLEKAVELKPDLILLDMMLPRLNGVEVIRELKARPETRAIPVVVMTAYPGEAQFIESSVLAMGAVQYLAKPVHIDVLLAAVEGLLAPRP